MERVSQDDIRLSDAERMDALQALGTHYAEGRLDLTEFNERTAKVAEARTHGELRPLFDDLPGGIPSHSPQSPAVITQSDELTSLKRKGQIVRTSEMVFSAVGMAVFFIGLMLNWNYSWLGFLFAGLAVLVARTALGFSDSDEKALKKLQAREDKRREQRLLEASEGDSLK